jgi:hypothetical protein
MMTSTLNAAAYQRLIDEDQAWLLAQPRTLERDHIEDCLKWLASNKRLIAELAQLRADAERWRKLRANHWNDGPETLVVVRARDLQLGVQTYSGERLDAAVDEPRKES